MGAPVAAVAVLGNSRTGGWLRTGILAAVVLAITVSVAPVATIMFVVAGATSSAAIVGPTARPGVSGEWGYPLDGDYFKGRGFGYNPVNGCTFCSKNHKGYDMAQGCGSTVYAAGPGRIIGAGASGGLGNAVRIDHGDGLVTIYGHMQWGSLRVSIGQEMTAGVPLGAEGNTGASFGCHLHFEVQQDGVQIAPEPFMADRGLPLK